MHAPGGSDTENRSPLPALSLCQEIERLVHIERRAAWLLCHHFAELADRFDAKDPELDAYENIVQLAQLRVGMPERAVRERVRVGRALRELPATRAAFAAGAISYAKVREVTRVAEPASEEEWLETARVESVRSLERKVARARHPDAQTAIDTPRVKQASEEAFVDVQLRLPAETWSLVLRAMDEMRRRSQVSLSDPAALEALARWALASRGQPAPAPAEEASTAGERGDVAFLNALTARTAEEVESEPALPSAPAEMTRPGHSNPEGAPSASDPTDSTRPGHDDALAPAPGKIPISDDSIDVARRILPVIENGAATGDEVVYATGLAWKQLVVPMLELEVAGVIAQTHRGLMLTPWAKRHRFNAVAAKLRH